MSQAFVHSWMGARNSDDVNNTGPALDDLWRPVTGQIRHGPAAKDMHSVELTVKTQEASHHALDCAWVDFVLARRSLRLACISAQSYILCLMSAAAQSPCTSLMLYAGADAAEVRRWRKRLTALADEVVQLDDDIAGLRDKLIAFESYYRAGVAPRQDLLLRAKRLIQQLHRWAQLLARPAQRRLRSLALPQPKRRVVHARRQPSKPEVQAAGTPPARLQAAPPLADAPSLKAIYRVLARSYHPDLAVDDTQRRQYGDVMARINALYACADMERLLVFANSSQGESLPDDGVAALQRRYHQLQDVLARLKQEQAILQQSDVYALYHTAGAQRAPRQLIRRVRAALQLQIVSAQAELTQAMLRLENAVERYNGERALIDLNLHSGGTSALYDRDVKPVFAGMDHDLLRLGLQAAGPAPLCVHPAVRRTALWLESLASRKPWLCRLLLLTYVSSLSRMPLLNLESLADLKLRYEAAGGQAERLPSLEKALVHADAWVEFGVRRVNPRLLHAGLHFLKKSLPAACAVAIGANETRRLFCQVLQVLGPLHTCVACQCKDFSLPLYRLRGIDDLRACACPRCGHLIERYRMPCGDDVPSLLNEAYLQHGLLVQFNFRLSQSCFAMQWVRPKKGFVSLETLRADLYAELFVAHGLQVKAEHVTLALRTDSPRTYDIVLAPDAAVSAAVADKLIRNYSEQRFRAC